MNTNSRLWMVGKNGRLLRAAVVAASVSSLHCGADRGDAGEPIARVSDAVVHQTIHAGDQADVFVSVEPNATCTLRGDGFEDMPLHADSRGVVTFFVAAEKVGAAIDLSLVCTGKAGGQRSVVHPIEVSVVSDDQATSAPTAWLNDLPFSGRQIPPLAEDPETVTHERLVELGLPRKPDRAKAPDEYAAWLAAVSTPLLEVDANPVKGDVENTIESGEHDIWTGEVTRGYSTIPLELRFNTVSGQWAVPQVTGQWPFPLGVYYSSTWVGLGGFNNTFMAGLPQTGTAQKANCSKGYLGWTCLGTYYAWFEYLPDVEQPASNFPVAKGNVIEAKVIMGNSMGQADPYGTYAFMRLTNLTRSITTWVTMPLPANATFFADSADWIMERPLRNGYTRLAQFPDTVMSNTWANVLGGDGNQYTIVYGDAPAVTVQLTMMSTADPMNPHPLASTSAGPVSGLGQALTFHWITSW